MSRQRSSIYPAHFGLISGTRPLGKDPRRGLRPAFDGYFASHKALGPSPFRTLLERDLQCLVSADSRIRLYAVEPHALTYWTRDGAGGFVKRRYTPDLVTLDRQDRVAVLDAKAAFFAQLPTWIDREPYIREAYREDHGVPFVVLTELQIRLQPRLSNCQIMLCHRGPPEDPEAELTVRDALAVRGHGTVPEMAAKAGVLSSAGANRLFTAAMRLTLRGEISFDLSAPLSPATIYTMGSA